VSELNVPVRTELTSAQYRALSALARQHHTTISSLVRECVRRQLAGAPTQNPERKPQRRISDEDLDAIREAHGRGLSDVAIGLELEIPRSTVSYWRGEMDLPALFSGRPRRDRGVTS